MMECPVCKSVEAELIELENGGIGNGCRPYFRSPNLDYLHLLICTRCGVVYLDSYQLERLKGEEND